MVGGEGGAGGGEGLSNIASEAYHHTEGMAVLHKSQQGRDLF